MLALSNAFISVGLSDFILNELEEIAKENPKDNF